MLKYLCCVLFLAIAVHPLAAREQQSATPTPSKPDYSQQAAVIEQFSSKLAFENDGSGTRELKARIRTQSDAGVQNYGLLRFSYASSVESINIDYVRVHKPDGSVVITPAENVQDMPAGITLAAPFYSDLREKHVAVKGLGIGDVLEYQVRWQTTKPLIPGQFWFADNFLDSAIVLDEQLEISVPLDRAVKWSSPKIKPTITEDGARRIFTWKTSNLTTKQDEEDHTLEAVTGTQPAPDVEISSFQSWDEVGRWYAGLQAERVQPSPAVRAKAEELTKGLTEQTAKIEALYHYVSTQFRYIGVAFGIGRYQPHSADDILSNQYGDCKDKHTLLASLLQSIGIAAYPALINSAHTIASSVPSPAQFDHVITAVPQGKGFLWLDTTTEVGPFGYLLTPLRDKPALVIPNDKPAEFVTTIADPPFSSSQTFKVAGKLSDSGVLTAKMEQTLRGDTEVIYRAVFRSVPQENWKQLVQNISYRIGFGGTVSDIAASTPDNTDSAFHLSYDYTRNDYSNWDERQVSPPLPPIVFNGVKDDQTKFTEPLWLGAPMASDFDAEIEMPKAYSIQSLPPDVNLKTDFAEYRSSYKNENGTLVAHRTFVIRLPEVPVAEFAEFKSFRKAVEDDENKYVVLSNPTASSSAANRLPGQPGSSGSSSPMSALKQALGTLPESTNPDVARMMSEFQTPGAGHSIPSSIATLKRMLAADPKFVRAWILLANMQMVLGEPDEAEQSFRSAIAADPNQPITYKVVGMFLMFRREFEEAIPIWQQLCKLQPEDTQAAHGLASALLSAKHYAEAAAAFESAVKLDPKDAALYAEMGAAYLRADNEEKATAAYKNALAIDSSALMLNDIAYEMTLVNKDLPQALEYAQQAVHQEEVASAKVQLSSLQDDDLLHTSTLAAYWDTLGWVYFRMNNLGLAEKYLNAAWTLSLDSVEGDHLAQVYEAEHKRRAAVRMEQLALYSLSAKSPQQIQDIKARLKQLSAGHSITSSSTDEIARLRTVKVPRITTHPASAEFFLVFAWDPKTLSSRIEDVKFISGSELLRNAGKTLRAIPIVALVPDDGPTRLVRRAVVGCYTYSGCSLVMYPPDMVTSVH